MERQSTDDGDGVVSLLNPVDKHQVIHVRGPGAPTLNPTVHPAPKAKVWPPHPGPAWVARRLRASPPRRLQSGLQERTGAKSSGRRPPRALTGACCLLAQLCTFSSTSIVSSNTIRARRNSYGESRISHRSLGFVGRARTLWYREDVRQAAKPWRRRAIGYSPKKQERHAFRATTELCAPLGHFSLFKDGLRVGVARGQGKVVDWPSGILGVVVLSSTHGATGEG